MTLALIYLSVGLAFFAWLLVARLERCDLRRAMERSHLVGWQAVGAWAALVVVYAVGWPIAIPLTLLSRPPS